MFTQDTRAEKWLSNRGIQFRYQCGIKYAELCPDWFATNLGRPDDQARVQDLILSYAESQANGSIFPAPLIVKTAAGYEVLDGCQRLSAADVNGATEFNGYILDASIPSDTRMAVRVCANNILNGKRESEAFTVARVVDTMYEQQKKSAKECADWSGITLAAVEAEIGSRKGLRMLKDLGLDLSKPANQKGFQKVFAQTFTKEQIDDAGKEIVKAVHAMQRAKFNNGEAESILERYQHIKPKHGVSPRTQLKSVTQAWTEEPDYARRLAGGSARSQHPIDNVIRSLRAALTTMKENRDLHADKDQAECIVELLKDIKHLGKRIVPREFWPVAHDLVV